MADRESIGVGLMGLGVVGSGVARTLVEKNRALAEEIGCRLALKKILVRDLSKPRAVSLESPLFTLDPQQILSDPAIQIVIEVIGGEQPAAAFIKQALLNGKYVVTANKEVIAKHGPELMEIAQQNGVSLLYEASVGGGIPLLLPLKQGLPANEISAIYAIINGTTNYILTKMSAEGLSFPTALKQAQELGYAEPDAANDIEGIDAAYKLAILATAAFHTIVRPEDVFRQGIARLAEHDFRYAKELDYEIKLLAIAKKVNGAIEVRVHPAFVPTDFLLAKVSGVYNAIQIEGDLVGKVLFYGEGAGSLPTSSAIVADVIAAAKSVIQQRELGAKGLSRSARSPLIASHSPFLALAIKPISELQTRYYLRMSVADSPGVLAQIARALGDRSISISSVIQKETDTDAQTAEIVIMTHPAREEFMRQALEEMEKLPVVKEICNLIRVEG
ncbi:MAG: homoserine dehydrogenase [Chloroflexi bacterium]|nr:homoserine dehydrogenase [Chloroflexota bacterium]